MTKETDKTNKKRVVNPAILKLRVKKHSTNQNQTLQYSAINTFKRTLESLYPGLITVGELGNYIRVDINQQNVKKPSLWKRIKFLIKG